MTAALSSDAIRTRPSAEREPVKPASTGPANSGMLLHEIKLPSERVYPSDDWKIIEKSFQEQDLPHTETIFATSNGYLGMRGNHEEGTPIFQSGTFINGFYDSWPIVYGEEAFGFAKTGQTMLNVTDGKTVRLYVDDEPFFLPTAELLEYERTLDMKSGILERRLVWATPSGKHVSITSRRFASFRHRHLAIVTYSVCVLNAKAPVAIVSQVTSHHRKQAVSSAVVGDAEKLAENDPRLAGAFKENVLDPVVHYGDERRIVLSHVARHSGMTLACGVDHVFDTACRFSERANLTESAGEVVFSVDAEPGEAMHLVKYVAYHTSRSAPAQELCDRAGRTLDHAKAEGIDALIAEQKDYMEDFWRRSDVEIDGVHARAQQSIRWNLFQLVQASGRAEGSGIPAKGLTGQAYEGHYFWDTEIYVLPFLTYTAPHIARNLLAFRHSMLPKARERARQVNQKGALFPWRTINGEEASAFFAAGTAQYHINADIIYALRKYVDITGDEEFLYDLGAEMLVETARLWRDLGCYPKGKDGRFEIQGVTGPDEYTAIVDNNTYTNLMARHNLAYAADVIEGLRTKDAGRFAALAEKTELDSGEIAEWRRAAEHMYVAFDEALGIHPQDDVFLQKAVWDFAGTPPDKYPLFLHYHPLVIYRFQVMKQPDVVLAMFLLGHEFSPEQKQRNFDYYDPLTTGDSSLSACIRSIMAAEAGHGEKASEYLRRSLLMDLADVGGNVRDGAHIASIGGSWMAIVYGIAGMRDFGGRLSFDPKPIVLGADRLRIPLMIRGRRLVVEIGKDSTTYRLDEGPELSITHRGREIALKPGVPVSIV
jgi:alpha,alpha-trehalose phosphorylase